MNDPVAPDDVVAVHRKRLGGTIRDLRITDGQTQAQLAEALGVTEAYLASVECGEAVISPQLRQALDRVFGSAGQKA